jgi:hypothetical protein
VYPDYLDDPLPTCMQMFGSSHLDHVLYHRNYNQTMYQFFQQ